MKEQVYIVTVTSEKTTWRNERGQLHRLDGPAIEHANGDKSWWIEGQLHRLDGPAVEWTNGYKEWWVEGKRHRIDGPAVERCDGSKLWYIEGRILTQKQFLAMTQEVELTSNNQESQRALAVG